MNIQNIEKAYAVKNTKLTNHGGDEFGVFNNILINRNVCEYFESCLPERAVHASGIYIYELSRILRAILQSEPENVLFEFGFICIAGTSGGNAIVVDSKTGLVYFSDHELIGKSSVDYYDHESYKIKTLKGLSYDNILMSLIFLFNTVDEFILKTLDESVADLYDDLDSGEYIANMRELKRSE